MTRDDLSPSPRVHGAVSLSDSPFLILDSQRVALWTNQRDRLPRNTAAAGFFGRTRPRWNAQGESLMSAGERNVGVQPPPPGAITRG
jgi:hypothetical protein